MCGGGGQPVPVHPMFVHSLQPYQQVMIPCFGQLLVIKPYSVFPVWTSAKLGTVFICFTLVVPGMVWLRQLIDVVPWLTSCVNNDYEYSLNDHSRILLWLVAKQLQFGYKDMPCFVVCWCSIGNVLCSIQHPVKVATKFEARVIIFNIEVPITTGYPVSHVSLIVCVWKFYSPTGCAALPVIEWTCCNQEAHQFA